MATTREIAFKIDAHMASSFGGSFGKAARTITKFHKEVNKALKPFSFLPKGGILGGLIGAGATFIGAQKVTDFLRESIDAAKTAQIHEVNYQTLMKKAPHTTQAQIESLKAYASELSHMGLVSTGVTKEGMAQLATFRLSAKDIKTLTPAMLDLAVRTHGLHVNQEQLQLTANQVGKVFTGQVGALRRVGISFDKAQEKLMKTGTQEEKVRTLTQVLQQNFGGLNATLAKTKEGKLINIEHRLTAMKKTLGERLLPLQERWLNFIVRHIPDIEKGFQRLVDGLEAIIATGERMYKWASERWGWLKLIIAGVVGQVVLFEGAIKTAMAVTSILTVIDSFRKLKIGIGEAKVATEQLAAAEATLGKGGLLSLLSRLGPYGMFAAAVVGGGMAMNYSENKYGVPPIQRYQKAQAERQRKAQAAEAQYRRTHKGKGPGISDLLPSGTVKPFQPFPSPLQILPHGAGGVFRRAHIGMIGEDGPEAVVPLTRPARARQVLAAAGLGGGISIVNHITLTGAGSDDAASIRAMAEKSFAQAAERFLQQQRRLSYSPG